MNHQMDHETQSHTSAEPRQQSETLLDVLQRRYAMGEISRDQFQEMKSILGLSAKETEAPEGHDAHSWEAA
jgi:uncharacterized membrane protein